MADADGQGRGLRVGQPGLGEEPGQVAFAGAGQIRLVVRGRVQLAHGGPERGQRSAVARVVPHAGGDGPAGAGDPAQLPQALYRVGHEVDDQLGQRGVKGVGRERQLLGR